MFSLASPATAQRPRSVASGRAGVAEHIETTMLQEISTLLVVSIRPSSPLRFAQDYSTTVFSFHKILRHWIHDPIRDQMGNVLERLAHVRETGRQHKLILEFGIGR